MAVGLVVDGGAGVGDAVGVGVFDAELGGGREAAGDGVVEAFAVGGDGAGEVQGPEGDVVVVFAPVVEGALGVLPPVA